MTKNLSHYSDSDIFNLTFYRMIRLPDDRLKISLYFKTEEAALIAEEKLVSRLQRSQVDITTEVTKTVSEYDGRNEYWIIVQ